MENGRAWKAANLGTAGGVEAELVRMERVLSKLKGFDGWMIGMCSGAVWAAGQNAQKKNYGVKAVKSGSASLLARVETELLDGSSPGEQEAAGNFLQVLLVHPAPESHQAPGRAKALCKGEPGAPLCHIDSPIRFSQARICRFLQEAADQNPIHHGPEAVVPGFLMMNEAVKRWGKAEEEAADQRKSKSGERKGILLNAKFLSPLRAEETASLEIFRGGEAEALIRLQAPDSGGLRAVMRLKITSSEDEK